LYIRVRRFWPVRVYPWGTCEALSSVHSDVGALKRLLFEEGYEELKACTEQRYYEFRSGHLLEDPTQCALLCFLFAAPGCAVCSVVCLHEPHAQRPPCLRGRQYVCLHGRSAQQFH
jgi:septin family protein